MKEGIRSLTRYKFLIFYVFMILSVFLIVKIPGFYTDQKNFLEKTGDIIKIEDSWTDENGNFIDLYDFNKQDKDEFFIYHIIPENLPEGTSLCFGTRNIYIDVYIDDKLVHTIPKEKGVMYNKSPGTMWHFINVSEADYGKTVKMYIQNVYDKNSSSINDVCFADSSVFILEYIFSKLWAILLCVLLFTMGAFFIFFDLYAYYKVRKKHDILFLGAFSMLLSLWSFLETGVTELFIADTRSLQNLKIYLLMLVPIPILYYMKHFFNMKNVKAMKGIRNVSVITFFVCTFLKIFNIADFVESIFLVHMSLIFTALFLAYKTIEKWVKNIREHKHDSILFYMGFIIICISCIIDLIRFYIGNGVTDAAAFIRIGLLLAVACYGTIGLSNISEKIKQGLESEVISKLAYQDGLTGVGNRTAYQKKLYEYGKNKNICVGLVMFDVNNLKKINDKFGHSVGDELIIKSANIIKDSFKDIGSCYRIGGDEFVVFISGKKIDEDYQKGIENMNTIISDENQKTQYEISIAYGMAVYNSKIDKDISDVLNKADEEMYICKEKIKKTARLKIS